MYETANRKPQQASATPQALSFSSNLSSLPAFLQRNPALFSFPLDSEDTRGESGSPVKEATPST